MTSGDHLQLDDDLLLSCFIDFMPSRPASHVLDEREPGGTAGRPGRTSVPPPGAGSCRNNFHLLPHSGALQERLSPALICCFTCDLLKRVYHHRESGLRVYFSFRRAAWLGGFCATSFHPADP